eukprot:UN02790
MADKGGTRFYKGPSWSSCYSMTTYYDFPHQYHCSWGTQSYGVLCQHPVQYELCEMYFVVGGIGYTVYSPRQEEIDPDQFCRSRGKTFASVTSEYWYNQMREKLGVWTANNNPSCNAANMRTGWYTRYRGPNSSKCYTMTTYYSFPHQVPCSWSNEDYGILCRG